MNKSTIIGLVVVLVIIIGGIVFAGKKNAPEVTASPTTSISASVSASVEPSVSPTASVSPLVSVGVVVPKTVTISYTEVGYNPANVTIKKGDTVKFVNNSAKDMWPASAKHPTHEIYPETGGCLGSKFDACARLKTGESYSFKFNLVGEWGYHDHISPNFFGKITVE